MKKHTVAAWSCAVLAAAVLAGCGNKQTAETAAVSSAEVTTEASTEAETEAAEKEDNSMDMVVAGGDASGLIAAIQAVRAGANPSKVMVIESSGKLGEDLDSMETFVNAANTNEQFEAEIEDSYEQFLADIKAAGNGKNSEELAEFVAESGEEVVEWLRGMNIEMAGVDKEEGSSVARSYSAEGEEELPEVLARTLKEQLEDLKIQVLPDTEVKEILFAEDGGVSGIKVEGKNGERTIDCLSLVIADEGLLPLLEAQPVQFTAGTDSKNNGLLVNNCAEVLDKDGGSIPGLYAVGTLIEPSVHGEKALAGNEMTAAILFGMTAGEEAGMYAEDNRVE